MFQMSELKCPPYIYNIMLKTSRTSALPGILGDFNEPIHTYGGICTHSHTQKHTYIHATHAHDTHILCLQ